MSKFLPNPAPKTETIVEISKLAKAELNVAFCTFRTLPRSGRIAWKFESRLAYNVPAAESPSTRINSLISGLVPLDAASLVETAKDSAFLSILILASSSLAI